MVTSPFCFKNYSKSASSSDGIRVPSVVHRTLTPPKSSLDFTILTRFTPPSLSRRNLGPPSFPTSTRDPPFCTVRSVDPGSLPSRRGVLGSDTRTYHWCASASVERRRGRVEGRTWAAGRRSFPAGTGKDPSLPPVRLGPFSGSSVAGRKGSPPRIHRRERRRRQPEDFCVAHRD